MSDESPVPVDPDEVTARPMTRRGLLAAAGVGGAGRRLRPLRSGRRTRRRSDVARSRSRRHGQLRLERI